VSFKMVRNDYIRLELNNSMDIYFLISLYGSVCGLQVLLVLGLELIF
jgi:hypothetical protein